MKNLSNRFDINKLKLINNQAIYEIEICRESHRPIIAYLKLSLRIFKRRRC
jgi:hypothetical protein